jgi:hypothetical protein
MGTPLGAEFYTDNPEQGPWFIEPAQRGGLHFLAAERRAIQMACNKPAGVFLPVKNLHFIKDEKGVKVSARCGKPSRKELDRLISFLRKLR